MHCPMGDMLKLIWWAVIGLFRSRDSLEAEILTLRHQLNVLRRKIPEAEVSIYTHYRDRRSEKFQCVARDSQFSYGTQIGTGAIFLCT
jgi:hypothetical protein